MSHPRGSRCSALALRATWHREQQDIPRWLESFEESFAYGPGTRLPGVIWTHTPGPSSGGFSPLAERELQSHYWSGPLLGPLETREPFPCLAPGVPYLPAFGHCPFCGTGAVPWFVFSSQAEPSCIDFEIPPAEFTPSLVLGPDLLEPQPSFDMPGIEHLVVPGVQWVAAAETGQWLAERGLKYVALDRSTFAPVRVLEEAGDGFVPTDELQYEQELPPVVPDAPMTLSATRRTVWFAAGSSNRALWSMTVNPEQHLATHGLATRGMPFGSIRALTYDGSRDVVWILEEIGLEEVPRRIRLSMFDPVRLRVHRVAEWRREHAERDRFAMSASPDGSLYVACGDTAGEGYVVTRLRYDGPDRVAFDGSLLASGRIARGALRASDEGLTLLVMGDELGAQAVTYERMDFQSEEGPSCF